jgi:cytochrome P450 family 4
MIFFVSVLTNRMLKAYDQYGGVVRLWLSIFPLFAVLDPQDLQTVLSSKSHTDKMWFYKLLHNFLGKGLITSSGKQK